MKPHPIQACHDELAEMRRVRDTRFAGDATLWLEADAYIAKVAASYKALFGDRWYLYEPAQRKEEVS